MQGLIAVSVVGLVGLAGAVALAAFIVRGGVRAGSRTAGLCAALVVAMLAQLVSLSIVSVYYKPPVLWIAALVVAVAAVISLFVLIGRDVKWKPARVAALVGFVVAVAATLFAVGMLVPGDEWQQPLYATRTKQIAQQNGFVALMPKSRKLPTDVLPVEALPEPDAGVSLGYDDFWIFERKAAKASTSEADLGKLVAAGAKPLGADFPAIPADAEVTTVTVQGAPALAVEFKSTFQGVDRIASTKPETTVLVVTSIQGVDVRIASSSGTKESEGEFVPFSAKSVGELVRIAENLEPVR